MSVQTGLVSYGGIGYAGVNGDLPTELDRAVRGPGSAASAYSPG